MRQSCTDWAGVVAGAAPAAASSCLCNWVAAGGESGLQCSWGVWLCWPDVVKERRLNRVVLYCVVAHMAKAWWAAGYLLPGGTQKCNCSSWRMQQLCSHLCGRNGADIPSPFPWTRFLVVGKGQAVQAKLLPSVEQCERVCDDQETENNT